MRKSSWVVVGLIAVLAIVLIYARTAARPKLTDEEQVQALLTKGQLAIERKDLKAALSCVSRSYSDASGLKFDTLRLQGARAFQESGQIDVSLDNASVSIKGSEALVDVDVTLDQILEGKRNRIYQGRLALSLRKESSKHWLVIPVQAWKVTTGVDALANIGG